MIKSLNVFANKLKVGQHRDHTYFADVAYFDQTDQNKNPKIESIFNTLSENI